MSKATFIVHWPGQDVLACDDHTVKLKRLGASIGCAVSATPLITDAECTNCVNEAKKKQQ